LFDIKTSGLAEEPWMMYNYRLLELLLDLLGNDLVSFRDKHSAIVVVSGHLGNLLRWAALLEVLNGKDLLDGITHLPPFDETLLVRTLESLKQQVELSI
jgi:hypothetical protein